MISLKIHSFNLEYLKPAKTSRGEYIKKDVLIAEWNEKGFSSYGEISPLPDLSIDAGYDFSAAINNIEEQLKSGNNVHDILGDFNTAPALQFALECCFLAQKAESSIFYNTAFTNGKIPLKINGLVWMDTDSTMLQAAIEKIKQGFSCIKFKVGALDHDAECRMLEQVRKSPGGSNIEIRLDANGAYKPADALLKLKDLSRFNIHSIEQPTAAGEWESTAEIVAKSPIDIALDEELIGIEVLTQGKKLLNTIKPKYIILKPTLIGGFSKCDTWIDLAERQNTGWWTTSALESNIGLGHIAQWVSDKNPILAQGLGTGGLYQTNFTPVTKLKGEALWFSPVKQPLLTF